MDNLQKLIEELQVGARQVEEERAKANAIFTSIGNGAIATDEHGKIVRVNTTALNMIGFSEPELVSQWYPKVIQIEDENGNKLNPISMPITKAVLEGKPVYQKIFYVRKDGSKLPVEVTVSPIILEDRPIGAIEIFRDISEDLKLEKTKSEFISLASHQLKTPSNAIKWNLELMEDGTAGPMNDKQKEIIKDISSITKNMIETVNALLNVSRIELNTFVVEPKPVDFVSFAKDAVKELATQIKNKQLLVEEKYDELPVVPLDPGLTHSVVDNIIANAVKYTKPGGKIAITVENQKDRLLFKVADTGVGIPASQKDKIFEKMFRAGNVSDIEGTGLGLYVVKSIVELAKGKIWFESEEGKGTTFYIEIPFAGMEAKKGTSKLAAE